MKPTKVIDVAALNEYFHRSDTFASRLDIEIIEANAEKAVSLMPLSPTHRNGMGNAHGGAIFSLADMTFAAIAFAEGTFYVNAQSSISYLEPGRIGPLRGEAKKIRGGKKLGVYEVRIFDSDDTLIAVSTITGYNTDVAIVDLDTFKDA